MKKEVQITDYNYIGSAIGNAYFSGLPFDQLWVCVRESETREELDAAVSASIETMERLKKLTKEK